MEIIAKTRKLGGSLIVTIPKNIVEHEGIVEGETIRIDLEKIKKSYLGCLPGLGEFTEDDRFDIRE